jgi:hypothetical protein
VLVRGVIVHHQVQLLAGAGAGDLAQEDQELLVAVPVLAAGGDLAGGDVQRREQGRGPVPAIVMGAASDQARGHRQDRRGPLRGLDLGLLVHAEHDRVLGRVQVPFAGASI